MFFSPFFANVREGELFCELESCVFVSLERNISWLAVLGSSIYLAILETGGLHHGFLKTGIRAPPGCSFASLKRIFRQMRRREMKVFVLWMQQPGAAEVSEGVGKRNVRFHFPSFFFVFRSLESLLPGWPP